jgi:thiol-disulfide isomerase/thioredoxin
VINFFHFAALALGLLGVSSLVLADDKQDKDQDKAYPPEARKLLGELADTYKNMSVYADEGRSTVQVKFAGQTQKNSLKLQLRFARPNKFDLDLGEVRVVSDGEEVTAAIIPAKKFLKSEAPPSVAPKLLANIPLPGGATVEAIFANPNGIGLPAAILFDLLAGTTVEKMIEGTDAIRLEADTDLDGQTVKSVFIDQTQGPDFRLLIDPKTKRLRQSQVILDPKDTQLSNGTHPDEVKVVWNAGTVKTQAAKDAFAYTPPADFTAYDPAKDDKQPKFPVSDLVGKPAPDFKLTALAGAGKTKIVTKADLAGKVIVIDFWATWCGPCLRELPHIQKLVDKYAEAKKDVVVVALSQDQVPKDQDALRKLVEDTLLQHRLKLAEGPVSLVALDPSNTVGQAFEVQAYPTVVLIDTQGIIQSAHVGFNPGVGRMLGKEIDHLLAGKSLIEQGSKPDESDKPQK